MTCKNEAIPCGEGLASDYPFLKEYYSAPPMSTAQIIKAKYRGDKVFIIYTNDYLVGTKYKIFRCDGIVICAGYLNIQMVNQACPDFEKELTEINIIYTNF